MDWKYLAHGITGTIITACQATALASPTPGVIKVCGIIALVATNVGVSFGVWQVTTLSQLRRDMQAKKLLEAPPDAPKAPEPKIPGPPPLPTKV